MVRKIEAFIQKLSGYPEEERNKIIQAVQYAERLHRDQKRASGEPFFIHPLQVAEILIDIRMDYQSIMAALLHDTLEDTELSRLELRKHFGKEVESLVNGVTKISILKVKSKTVQESETIRKMLFAMIKDIRVILIKLADKLHNMRTLQYLPEAKRKSIATECLDIYAPLAGRLGISSLKNELEDLALKHINHDAYEQIRRYVAEKRDDRDKYLARVQRAILDAAAQEGLEIEILTRAKHFYSIYRKMKRKGKQIDEIYDLLGIRIICNSESECYNLLGIVHKLWIPIEGRFKDYIAMPKANKYQSLHTTVMGYDGKLIEIQIRTNLMNQTAEYGIAAHWLYKAGYSPDSVDPHDLAIVTKLKSWNGIRINSREFLDEIKRELLKDSIYVFTPKGDVVELVKGSTAVDFAYHIHTEVGNRCFAAKADGVIIPLDQELKNTQVVEIITANSARPHINWLRFVKSAKARAKIRSWLTKYDDTLIIDRNIVAKKKKPEPSTPVPAKPKPEETEVETQVHNTSRFGVRVGDERNMMIRFARCCNPTTGDPIIGFVSRGRGIIVHKKSCPNIQHISEFEERKIDVEWESVSSKLFRRFKVTARRTSDLFSEIEGAIRKYHGHLVEGKLTEKDPNHLTGYFTMELENKDDSKKIMKSIRSIPAVLNIQPAELPVHAAAEPEAE